VILVQVQVAGCEVCSRPSGQAGPDLQPAAPAERGAGDHAGKDGEHVQAGPDLGNEPLRSRSQLRAVLLRATYRRISVRHDAYHMRCGGAPR
jgi:hypothetical protein